jgi:hypothetical protein
MAIKHKTRNPISRATPAIVLALSIATLLAWTFSLPPLTLLDLARMGPSAEWTRSVDGGKD